MKLNFNHLGVKIFFIAFAVAGRAKVLSKIVDEKSWPGLTGLGEAVKAALLAIHKVNEAVGISDFMITSIVPATSSFPPIKGDSRDRMMRMTSCRSSAGRDFSSSRSAMVTR